jgi:hypothetical protein
MSSRRVRFTSSFVILAAALAITGLVAPGASAAVGDLQVAITNQPADAGVGDLITADPFDPTGGDNGYVRVHVTHTVEVCVEEVCHLEDQDLQNADVSFSLLLGGVDASDNLSVDTRTTNADGNATFEPLVGSLNPLSIDSASAFSSTHYKLVPVATFGETTQTGPASGDFDIWEDACHGAGCDVSLRDGGDTYVAQEDVGMAASELVDSTHITCKGQRKIFANDLFFHVTTTTDGSDAVKLTSFITADDFRAAGANFGQAHVDWCVGLESAAPWRALGVKPTTQSFGGTTFFVALAPKCPSKKQLPPCILSRMSDGVGGAIVTGWLPGGDPPRRT